MRKKMAMALVAAALGVLVATVAHAAAPTGSAPAGSTSAIGGGDFTDSGEHGPGHQQ